MVQLHARHVGNPHLWVLGTLWGFSWLWISLIMYQMIKIGLSKQIKHYFEMKGDKKRSGVVNMPCYKVGALCYTSELCWVALGYQWSWCWSEFFVCRIAEVKSIPAGGQTGSKVILTLTASGVWLLPQPKNKLHCHWKENTNLTQF